MCNVAADIERVHNESFFLLLCTEGVQLLCLIDKGLDACRYLQTYGEWDRAAWLAKVISSPSEQFPVLLQCFSVKSPLFLSWETAK